jgi:hypothetical protein
MTNVVLGGERPKMDNSRTAYWPEDLPWLIKNCWAEFSDQRPTFTAIKRCLEDMIKKLSSSPRKERARTVFDFNEILHIGGKGESRGEGESDAIVRPPEKGFGSIKKPSGQGRNWSAGRLK